MSKPSATDIQVGGNHYAKLPVQPMRFAIANNWDPAAYGILKYVTRYKEKAGKQDLVKAQHLIALRWELWHSNLRPAQHISATFYCEENGLGISESSVIQELYDWVLTNSERSKMQLEWALERLIHNEYPDPEKLG